MYQIKASVGAFLVWALIVPACTSHDDSEPPVDMRVATSDVIRQSNPVLEPTRPEGGIVRGRVASLSAEENADRVARNKKEPIVWGESAAGISMATEYLKGLDILAEPLGTFQGFHYYNENVRIAWGSQGKRTPLSIIIDVGYQGALQLPFEFGDVRLGSSLKSRFPPNDPTGKEYIRALSRAFENMGPDFDCFAINVCNIVVEPDLIEFSFRNGSLLFSNDDKRELRFVYFLPKLPQLTTPLIQPLVFGDSAGGVSMSMGAPQISAVLGSPVFVAGVFSYYDNGNLAIAWDGGSKPLSIFIDRGYQGTWELPAPLGSWRLNSDKSVYFPNGDPLGIGLLKDLGRIFDGKTSDPSYDCQLVNSCRAYTNEEGTEITFEFDRGLLIFDNTAEKRLASIYYSRPKPARTEPLTTALNFPMEVAGIRMDMSQADALAILGEPRRIAGQAYFYDNDNIIIVWGNQEPRKPAFIQVNRGHRGDVSLPDGPVKMGADMSAALASVAQQETTIKAWSRYFRAEADVNYDCLAAMTCALDDDAFYVYFLFKDHGFFVFSKNSKQLLYIIFDPTQDVE